MSTVVQAAGNIELDNAAAAGYLTAQRDARQQGFDLYIYQPVGGLRTVAQIKQMQAAYDLPRGTAARARALAVWGMDRNSRARPITSSPHVSGFCADIGGSGFAWMVENGERYGFRRTLVAQGDFPHFQFFPGLASVPLNVTHLGGLASTGAAQIGDDDMPTQEWLTKMVRDNVNQIVEDQLRVQLTELREVLGEVQFLVAVDAGEYGAAGDQARTVVPAGTYVALIGDRAVMLANPEELAAFCNERDIDPKTVTDPPYPNAHRTSGRSVAISVYLRRAAALGKR